jgi:hypothetical protein
LWTLWTSTKHAILSRRKPRTVPFRTIQYLPWWKKEDKAGKRRAECTEKPNELLGQIGNLVFADVKLRNMSGWPWPTNLHLKKVDGDGVFEELNIGEKVIGKETTERSLAITMPTTPGQYHITFGFFYGRGAECGDRFTINLIATRPDVQEEDFVD